MAKKITLFTRFMKAFSYAKDGVVPGDATSVVELETGAGFAWKATKVAPPTTEPEPEPEPEPDPENP